MMVYMKKKVIIKVKVNQTELPNKMHFEVQKATRAQIYKPRKGKGSYSRKSKHKENI